MLWWKYSLVDKETELVVRAEGFFETETDAEEAGKESAGKFGSPERYDILTAQHSEPDYKEEASAYNQEIQKAIRRVYEACTGEKENVCLNIFEIRKALVNMFKGCFPCYTGTFNEGTDLHPCFYDICDSGCVNCPALTGAGFPVFDPKTDSVNNLVSELIRCIKCDKEYVPDANEIESVIKIVMAHAEHHTSGKEEYRVCPHCKGTSFYAHQMIRADVIVDGNNIFQENAGKTLEVCVYDAEDPYGPYTCVDCGFETDDLDELETVSGNEMQKIHRAAVIVPKKEAAVIRRLTGTDPKTEEDCLGEDDTISGTADFGNGIQMDVKICGVRHRDGEDNSPWTEAVLFRNGSEITCSDPSESYFGAWELKDGEDTYICVVKEEE